MRSRGLCSIVAIFAIPLAAAAAAGGPIGSDADLHEVDRRAGWGGVPFGERSWGIRFSADSLHGT